MAPCPNVLRSGRCGVRGCAYDHGKIQCTCGMTPALETYNAHLRGKKHKAFVNNGPVPTPKPASTHPAPMRCDVCCLNLSSWAEYDAHHLSQAHRRALARASSNPTSAPNHTNVTGIPAAPGYLQCNVCGKDVHVDVWLAHTTRHTSYQQHAAVDAVVEEAEKDKNGIAVSYKGGIDYGIIDPKEALHPDLRRTADVKVSRTDNSDTVILHTIRLASSTRGDHYGIQFSAALLGASRHIKPNMAPRTISVTFHPAYEGRYEDTLELTFQRVKPDQKVAQQFVITRGIRAVVGSQEDYENLKPKAPYVRPKARYQQDPKKIIRVPRPTTWSQPKWKVPLPQFDCPEDLADAVRGQHAHAKVKQFLPELSLQAYTRFFEVLQWCEEKHLCYELELFSKFAVPLKSKGLGYILHIPGLAEGRPSVIVGDIVLVKHAFDKSGTWYEGCVHEIGGGAVFLRFNASFKPISGDKVDVRFTLNRLPDRRIHQALVSNFAPPRLLFPNDVHIQGMGPPTYPRTEDISLVNRNIAGNAEQLQAVRVIRNRPPGSVPFVIFGPPGTGKTITLVEAMNQILLADPKARILACAPTNSLADEIAFGLSRLNTRELFRLNSYARPFSKLLPSLRDYSLYNDNEVFAMPTLEKLVSYRVVVSTLISGGVPHALGVPRGHFTHIFIDEAAEGTEPMTMVPIKTLAGDSTNIVLAGDMKQLRPVIHSKIASALGLKVSYMERLMHFPVYNPGPGQGVGPVNIIKLVKHFRSHPSILQFPNRQFYDDELQPCADEAVTNSMLRYDRLTNKTFPVIFHGVIGRDQREESSPSFFNIDEVSLVKSYVESLMEDRKLGINPVRDIGIIAPYHAQCQKILSRLPDRVRGIKVGSVEEFQGQERRIIIISTVRSSQDFLSYDIRHNLGFVADPRRFNVSITRARSLLIVIGNPRTLAIDPMWRAWLNFVHENKGWRGVQISWNPEDSLEEEGYAAEVRKKAEAEAEEMIQRLQSCITNDFEIPRDEEGNDDGIDTREYPVPDRD